MSKTITVLFALLMIVCAEKISQEHLNTPVFMHYADGITGNTTGDGISTVMAERIKRTIELGFSYYAYNIQQNTRYISTQLQSAYQLKFNVIIIKENTPTVSFYLWSTNSTYLLWTKVNPHEQNWIYIIWGYAGLGFSNYIDSAQKGSGITSSIQSVVKNVILSEQNKYSACYCYNLREMGQKLKEFDSNYWSIWCKSYTMQYMKGIIYSYSDMYMQTRPGTKCEYLVNAI